MKLNDEERRIMVSLEYEKALSFLEQAEKIAAMDLWDVVANRLYYSIFHAVSALLIKDGHKVSTHKGTLVMFGQHYVKTGIFPGFVVYTSQCEHRTGALFNQLLSTYILDECSNIANCKSFLKI